MTASNKLNGIICLIYHGKFVVKKKKKLVQEVINKALHFFRVHGVCCAINIH